MAAARLSAAAGRFGRALAVSALVVGALLATLAPASVQAQAQAQSLDGAALFARHCAACHQTEGGGTVGLAPPIKGRHWQSLAKDPGYLPSVVLHGLSGPIRIDGKPFVGAMPPLAGQLDDASIAAIGNHVAGLQGRTQSPALTAADVAAERASGGSQSTNRQRREALLKP